MDDLEPEEEPLSITEEIRDLRIALRDADRLARDHEDRFQRVIFRNTADDLRNRIRQLEAQQIPQGNEVIIEEQPQPIPQEHVQEVQDQVGTGAGLFGIKDTKCQFVHHQQGNGIFIREAGKLQPSGRQLLSEVGNEEIKSLDIVRTPLSSFTKTFLNIISLGQFEKISKKYYDEMFHLSLWINGKYNLEKNEVVNFSRTNPRKSDSQVKSISNIPAGITIQSLIDNTIKRMGPENFSNYDAEKLNCQNFLLNVINANGIGDKSDEDFIYQDATKIFQELPAFSKVLGKVSVKLGAIFNRLLYGEGEERQQGGTDRNQKGDSATYREWVDNMIYHDEYGIERPLKELLNRIIHSGDSNYLQFGISNEYADQYGVLDTRISKLIDFGVIKNRVKENKKDAGLYNTRGEKTNILPSTTAYDKRGNPYLRYSYPIYPKYDALTGKIVGPAPSIPISIPVPTSVPSTAPFVYTGKSFTPSYGSMKFT